MSASGNRPRVLLVFPSLIKPDSFFGFLLPPLGLERIAACLETFADVKILDLRFEGDGWLKEAADYRPDFIGVNVKTTLYAHSSYRAADRLRMMLPGAKIILGGLHASSLPSEALTHGDVVVIGEGEQAMSEIVMGKPLDDISGILFRGPAGKTVATAPRPPLRNLDSLPPPARHLRPEKYVYSAAGLIKMDLLETSRGCDRKCPFCSSAVVQQGKWRSHSPEYVLAEVRRLWKNGVKYVMLTDDHFSTDLERAKKISELIAADGIRIAFFCFLRPFTGRMDVKRAMVDAGFVLLSYGAESPNPEQLKKYGKGFSDPEGFIKQVNREWHEAGARYIGNSFVFGDPDERVEDIERFGDYACQLDPTYIEPLYSQPFPGTRYREEMSERGLLTNHGWDQFTEGRMLVRHPVLSESQLRNARVDMWLRFFSPRKIAGAFRVPLYLREVVGLPLRTVLKYMKACDYCLFGCVLEDKYYFHRRRFMVRKYLSDYINSFPPHEREMTPFTDEFTDMIGAGLLKRSLGNGNIGVEIFEEKKLLSRFIMEINNGKVKRFWAGLEEVSLDYCLKIKPAEIESIFCGTGLEKFVALARICARNIVGFIKNRFSNFFTIHI